MTLRNLARVSASGLLAAGVLALAATPALAAADVDFSVDATGSTIALGAGAKPATVSLTNHGTTTPDHVGVTFDVTDLDSSKVEIDLGGCTVEEGVADCQLDESVIPGPGRTVKTDVPLVLKDGAADDGPGSLGKMTVTVTVEGDTNDENNSRTVDVQLAGSGGDLRVIAEDVTAADSQNQLTGEPLAPGATSWAYAYVFNHGDRATQGLKVDVKLPEHVTFAEEEGGCEYAADKSEATCTATEYPLIPWSADETPNKANSSGTIAFKVTVSEDAEGPVTLDGGKWTIAALGLAEETARKSRTATTAPEFLTKGCEEDQVEVDESDNTDTFVALVAGPDGGAGGGNPDGPGLPVTGPVAATVAGVGGAVVVIGAALFMVSRRRRVVLVTPGDEK